MDSAESEAQAAMTAIQSRARWRGCRLEAIPTGPAQKYSGYVGEGRRARAAIGTERLATTKHPR